MKCRSITAWNYLLDWWAWKPESQARFKFHAFFMPTTAEHNARRRDTYWTISKVGFRQQPPKRVGVGPPAALRPQQCLFHFPAPFRRCGAVSKIVENS